MLNTYKELEDSIEENFNRFDSAKKRYEASGTLDDYADCVSLLPIIVL